ncbi:MAG: ABC transporter ATP-binding protein [Actinobacteria bacterium]|nr:ABC transporter ATP-binding protein [Actinomycetota bacterium]
MALLKTYDMTVRYGGLAANADVNLEVPEGKLVGLIGPNGAGKTTFIDAITGFTNVSSGRVEFDGHDLEGMTPDRRAHLGLVRTFQSLELFEDLTVRENLLVAAEKPTWWSFIVDLIRPPRTSAEHEARVGDALSVLGLNDISDRLPMDLSHGQRKLVGVARALAAKPKLLLLDEPAAGLDTTESQLLGQHLRTFLETGTTIFLIDHDMGLVLNVCDYIYVLDFGKIIAEGTPAQIRKDPAVIGAYLGQSAGEAQAKAGEALAARTAGASGASGATDQASDQGGDHV